jgi:peroxin-4
MISVNKRLNKELIALGNNPDENIVLIPNEGDITEWRATIRAPPQSAYDGYEFDLRISVPSQYPIVPPSIRFITKIFHPNILFEVCPVRVVGA